MSALRFDSVRDVAAGQWPAILERLGIDPAALRNRHGPCPGCGGKDRFRFDDQGIGRFFCGGGGADPLSGDGFKLLQHVHDWTARESLQAVAGVLGMDAADHAPIVQRRDPEPAPKHSPTRNYALKLWMAADTADAVVGSHPYALAKDITWAAGAGRATASGTVVGPRADCLIVPIRTNGTGKVQGVQAINANGKKQTFGDLRGGFLLLGNTLDRSIPWYVCEGWASAVSVVFHHHRGDAVCAVAFGKEQMQRVAEAMDAEYHTHIQVLKEQD